MSKFRFLNTMEQIFNHVCNFGAAIISSFLVFWLAPRLNLSFEPSEDFVQVILRTVGQGAFLYIASFVNGHDLKMLRRSKADFIVNSFVSSVIAVLFFCLALYIFQYGFVGRRVVILIVANYVLVAFALSVLRCKLISNKSVIYADLNHECNDEFAKLNFRSIGFEIKPIDNIVKLMDGNNRSMMDLANKCVFIVASYPEIARDPAFKISILPEKLCHLIVSRDIVTESLFEFVSLRSNFYKSWWEVQTKLRNSSFCFLKRAIDIFIVIIICIPALMVLAIAGAAIKLFDRGPIFYRQIRVGQFGKTFWIIKLRSMKVDSERQRPQWASVGDPRVTKVGRILRKSRIDELPQIWNVLIGEMSFVGPRPERPEFYSIIEKEVPEFSLRLVCKPGLTGWAQINYPYGASVEDSRMKLLYDLYYIKHAGLLLEFRIITRTLIAMIRGAR